jgi:hypothetical protein
LQVIAVDDTHQVVDGEGIHRQPPRANGRPDGAHVAVEATIAAAGMGEHDGHLGVRRGGVGVDETLQEAAERLAVGVFPHHQDAGHSSLP